MLLGAGQTFAKTIRETGGEAILFNGQDRNHVQISNRIGEPDDDLTKLMFRTLAEWRQAKD